jgi:hypothetical protein
LRWISRQDDSTLAHLVYLAERIGFSFFGGR